MLRYVFKRLLIMIPVVLGVVFIVFSINRLSPGDPVVAILGVDYTQEQYDAKYEELGLDDPFLVQFFNYIKGIVLEGDLGTSYKTKRPVWDEVAERFPTTLTLGLLSIFLGSLLGGPAGILSATKQYSFADYTTTVLALFFCSVPNFWMAMMLILIFSHHLGWFPASGLRSFQHWILPTIALSMPPLARMTRMTRSCMLEIIRSDYIRTARAKGVKERVVVYKHALRNALIPIVTQWGMQLGVVIGGTVILENIFSIAGIGSLMMTAINNEDYPVIQGCVLTLSIAVCLINMVVDMLYGFIDPRIKSSFTTTDTGKRFLGKLVKNRKTAWR